MLNNVDGSGWYSAERLAKKIAYSWFNSYKKGQDIELVGCATGAGSDSFAQDLANELKKLNIDVTVWAPTKKTYYTFTSETSAILRVQEGGEYLPFTAK